MHFHILFLDGVYISNKANKLTFKQVNAPTKDQLQTVVQRISERLAKLLTRQGLLTQDDDSAYLTLDALDDNALHHLQSHSVTYRVAVCQWAVRFVVTAYAGLAALDWPNMPMDEIAIPDDHHIIVSKGALIFYKYSFRSFYFGIATPPPCRAGHPQTRQ